MDADALLSALADLVADRVAERLNARGRDASTYSSDELPPDCPSKARFHELVKKIPGAEKRGRRWFVPADAWRSARSTKRKPAAAPVRDDVDEIIAGAGFRPTRVYREG